MPKVFCHPLGPIPWSIANADGTIKKPDKSALGRKLEGTVTELPGFVAQPAQTVATVIDGMSLLQKIRGDNYTFQEISRVVMTSVLCAGVDSDRIDVVFDVYKTTSIKNLERLQRSAGNEIQFNHIRPAHRVRYWRKMLLSPQSKTQIVLFLVENWKEDSQRERLEGKELFVTSGETCYKISKGGVHLVEELFSTQEEAETRILLHSLHASSNGCTSVIVVADDTDVLVLCIAFQSRIDAAIYVQRGGKTKSRLMNIKALTDALGPATSQAMIGLHAFTGCDSVSAFGGRGKIGAFTQMSRNKSFVSAFARLGRDWFVDSSLFKLLEEFICRLYSSRSFQNNVNELRYHLFNIKRGALESGQLPPCRDCLMKHAARANYQAAIWRRALEGVSDVPSPTNCGWTIVDDRLMIKWMDGLPAPEVLLDLMSCGCSRKCDPDRCSCRKNGIRCTDMCHGFQSVNDEKNILEERKSCRKVIVTMRTICEQTVEEARKCGVSIETHYINKFWFLVHTIVMGLFSWDSEKGVGQIEYLMHSISNRIFVANLIAALSHCLLTVHCESLAILFSSFWWILRKFCATFWHRGFFGIDMRSRPIPH